MSTPRPVLYHCANARSFRVLWALEEMGLDYELVMLPFPPRVLAPQFLQQNPLGTVPLFVDGAVRMTESAAICHYLAARDSSNGWAVAPHEGAAFAAYLNALHFGEATLTFPQAVVLRYALFEPAERRQPQVAEDYSRWFLARLNAFAAVMGSEDYVAAGRFTVADISVGYALKLAQVSGLAAEFPPVIVDYWERLQARAGYQRAMAAQERAGIAQGVMPTEVQRG
jgi:glutathione S-transferase